MPPAADAPPGADGSPPPVVVLGVARSGTTLLKSMLASHSQLAIPTESHFIPVLWERNRLRPTRARVLRDVTHVQRLREWGVPVEDVCRRIGSKASFATVIRELYRSYAAEQGKVRFGDKTPIYLDYVRVLERTFPDAQYVHIVRDGRNAALSYLAFVSTQPRGPLRPRTLAGYACRWRASVERGRALGEKLGPDRYLELRFEDLVAGPEAALRGVCAFLRLDYEPGILSYHERARPTSESAALLARPPGPARSSWETAMDPGDVRQFEAIAGSLLDDLGYVRASPAPSWREGVRAVRARATYRSARALWLGSTATVRCLPFCPRHGL